MLNKPEIAVRAHFMKPGTVEQHAHAKAKRELYPSADKKFVADAADGDPDADADDSPADEDMSATAHIARARNHLDAAMDGNDDLSVDERIDRAMQSLLAAREARRGAPGALGQHARVTFVR